MDNKDIFEFVFNPDEMAGVFGVSLVANPAIDIQMMQFSSEEIIEEVEVWKMASEEKRILTSPVMIPNQMIPRKSIQSNGGKPGFVYASVETIEQLQQNFAKQKYNHNSTIDHKSPIEGVYFHESWIIEDPKNDKANALGFKDLPKGTWMLSMKVENGEVWNEFVKTGKIKGFSIDGQLATKQINNTNIKFTKMNKQTMLDVIRMSIDSAIQRVAMATDLIEYKISDELSYFGSALEMGAIIFDKDNNPIIDSEFIFEGNKYDTDELGAIKQIEDVKPEEEVKPIEDVPVVVDEDSTDVPVEDIKPMEDSVKQIADLEAEVEKLKKDLEESEAKNAKLEADLVSKTNEVVTMSKETPASVGIVDRPQVTAPSNHGSLSKMEILRNAIQNNNK